MLGRRQIREKVVGNLYSFYINPINLELQEKKMLQEISKIFNLYVYQLNFLVGLKNLAEQQLEIAQQKYIKSDKEVLALQKFSNNTILKKIEDNPERIAFTSKHKELSWDLNDDLLVKIFQKIINSKRFQDYCSQNEESFEEKQKFIGKLFLRYIAENDDFHSHLERIEISWCDDFHISNSMIQKTIGYMKELENMDSLIKIFKDTDDEFFAKKLLKESISNWEKIEKKIEAKLENWELSRIAIMDRIILIAAITEIDFFPQTHSRIIINEYIEIAKVFATDKSHVFINGILDKYTKEIGR